jgi:drug/metabolite transporter superfamily protein YnfA
MILPFVLFFVFALLSAAGAYLAVAHLRGPKAGFWAAGVTALFFAVLFAGLLVLLRSSGLA